MPDQTLKILRIDASQRRSGSATRAMGDALMTRLGRDRATQIDQLDLALDPIPPVTEDWIAVRGADPAADATPGQAAARAASDALIARLTAADVIAIGAPMYNFGPPAALKAWIDQIARARVTFRYSDQGPVGLVTGKKAYLLMASGGAPINGPTDFATPYLRHVLGFIGITDVTLIDGGGRSNRPDALEQALAQIDALPSP